MTHRVLFSDSRLNVPTLLMLRVYLMNYLHHITLLFGFDCVNVRIVEKLYFFAP